MKLISRMVFGLVSVLVCKSFASLPGYCMNENVRQISRPTHNGSPSNFNYRYSFSPGAEEASPVVIFIPGGPGQTSMQMPLSIPDDFSVVRTDPRGMGCNDDESLNSQSLRSEFIAEDIAAIIRDLKPAKYILYGISYGTVVATMAESMIESQNLPPAQAVVLEGTIGRAFHANEYFVETLHRWQEIKSQLPSSIQNLLNQKNPPLRLSSKAWAAWLSAALIYGVLPSGDNYAVSELMALDPSAPEGPREGLKMRIGKMSEAPSESKIRIYKEITCREIAPDIRDVKYDYDWKDGNLVVTSENLCQGVPWDRPFDAAKYPIHNSSIYYFVGQKDPITPGFQYLYHLRSEPADRFLIELSDGGHQTLATNLADCSGGIWKSILQGTQEPLLAAFQKCAAKDKIHFQNFPKGSNP